MTHNSVYKPSVHLFHLACGLTALLAVAAGCHRAAAPTAASPQVASGPTGTLGEPAFIGNAACAECHLNEFRAVAGSRHSHTLHRIAPSVPTPLDPPSGPIAGTKLGIDTFGGDYVVVTSGNDLSGLQALAYAFGSGKIGITYATPISADTVYEMHMTWFPHDRRWKTTLGQETLTGDVAGKIRHDARQCFLCHAVTLPPDAPEPEPRFFGVGCESCHGPGNLHIAAMRRRGPDSGLARLEQWDSVRVNGLCGKCHGTEQSIRSERDRKLTYRFQPIGIERSRCYTATGGRLSCLTCHDPHRDASTSQNAYESICISCHKNQTTPRRTSGARSCPINPQSGCIRCHMPGKKAIPGSDLTHLMADHRIGIYRAFDRR